MGSKLSRRAFLTATTTSAAFVAAAPRVNAAKVVPNKISPNEKMNVAGIGVGGKGTGDIMACRRENVVAMADPDWNRAAEAFYKIKDAEKFKDWRDMLDKMGDKIDACTISTPDHSHAPAAYAAMMMGKHVFVQKPLTHTVAEARLLRKIAKETGVTTQMGNQGHCQDGVRKYCELVWNGDIGQVEEAHVWTNRPVWPQGIKDPLPSQAVPDHMHWDVWIGPAPWRPYNEDYAPFKWRGWWDFGCGAIGDMACHIMDPVFWSLKLMDAKTFTCEVVKQEGMTEETAPLGSVIKYNFPARGDMGPVVVYWHDGSFEPPRPADIPEDEKMGDGDNGSLLIGTKGYATAGEYGGDPRLLPDAKMKAYTFPEETLPRVRRQNPHANWIDACKGEAEAASHFGYAGPLTEVANMGNVALLAGEKIEYDAETGQIINNEGANKYLSKEYRRGWELPV
ncbi:MAG: Gfo/Idh/MocA family protein [Candidatus Hydrogenedentota bacterium]